MPIYEFKCGKCQIEFELLVTSAASPARCPVCGGARLSRLMSSFRRTVNYDSIGATGSGTGRDCAGCGGGNCANCF